MIELYQNEYVAEFLIYTHLEWHREKKRKKNRLVNCFIFAAEPIASLINIP